MIGRYILLMLFLAILVQNFDSDSINLELEKKTLKEAEGNKESRFKKFKNWIKEKLCCNSNESSN